MTVIGRKQFWELTGQFSDFVLSISHAYFSFKWERIVWSLKWDLPAHAPPVVFKGVVCMFRYCLRVQALQYVETGFHHVINFPSQNVAFCSHNFCLHFMHNTISFVDAFGISADRYESCWNFLPILRKSHIKIQYLSSKAYSLKMVLIINKSSLIVFFSTCFSFISQTDANSFFILQKHSVNTGSSQPVCG